MLPQEHIDKLASLFKSGKIDYIRQAIHILETLCCDTEDFCNLLNGIAENDIVSPNELTHANISTISRPFNAVGTSIEIRETAVL